MRRRFQPAAFLFAEDPIDGYSIEPLLRYRIGAYNVR